MKPNLILIDGGRAQVNSVLKALDVYQLKIPVLGLAKRQEEIIFKKNNLSLSQEHLKRLSGKIIKSPNFINLTLPRQTALLKFLQRLRDASHRLALRYHNYLHRQSQTKSPLLDLPFIGEKTYQKLIEHFGSLNTLKQAQESDLARLVTRRQLKVLKEYFKTQ